MNNAGGDALPFTLLPTFISEGELSTEPSFFQFKVEQFPVVASTGGNMADRAQVTKIQVLGVLDLV